MDTSERQRRVAEEAADWWVTLRDGATRTQREQYVDWLRESSIHVAEMLRIAQVHGTLEQFHRWSSIAVEAHEQHGKNVVRLSSASMSHETAPGSPASRSRRIAFAVAATLLVAATAAALFEIHRSDETIHTERGERREVALEDGSVVQVDPETSLRIRYEDHMRRVVLERGRALFHVAKNPQRPFLVEANATTVRAVGTAFAVEKNDNESLLVTVAEGTVAVFPSQLNAAAPPLRTEPASGGDRSGKDPAPVPVKAVSRYDLNGVQDVEHADSEQRQDGSDTQLLVTAGQQVSVAKTGGPETVHSVDSARELAWAEGRLIFDNSSVADAVLQFNRYNRIQIIVHDKALAHRLINGTFNAADPESFAAFVQSVARVRINRNERADITIDAVN